jgi:adenine-specific DNA-methyltransferase
MFAYQPQLFLGDCIERMRDIADGSVDLTITSPPYNIGKPYENVVDLAEYVAWQTNVVKEVVRVTRDGGSICWQVGN